MDLHRFFSFCWAGGVFLTALIFSSVCVNDLFSCDHPSFFGFYHLNIYINGYMNGPIVSVNIIRNIISISSMIIGASQYFFRFFMNSNSSFNVPSFPINVHLLKVLILLRLTCRRLILLRVCDHWRSNGRHNVHVLFHLFDLHVL